MTEPRYAPHLVFSTVPVIQELDCFYCPIPINPITDEEYFAVTIPNEETVQFHLPCFEEFAWLMLTYYHQHVHREEKVNLTN